MTTESRKRLKYAKEFKRDSVALVAEQGYKIFVDCHRRTVFCAWSLSELIIFSDATESKECANRSVKVDRQSYHDDSKTVADTQEIAVEWIR